jgi:hypothetical protein
MRSYMFRNRFGAVLFVISTLLGVATLIGSEDQKGALLKASEGVKDQQTAMASIADQPVTDSQPVIDDESVEFTPDDELIDDATGFDPSPVDEDAPKADSSDEAGDDASDSSDDGDELDTVPHDDVVIVSRDPADADQ